MAIGTGLVEDINGAREDGIGPGQAGYGMMVIGTRPGRDGDGGAVTGKPGIGAVCTILVL